MTNTKFDYALFRAVYIYILEIFVINTYKRRHLNFSRLRNGENRPPPLLLSTPPRYELYTVIKGSSMETSFILDNFSQNV